ncbi:hypothetical protein NHQ30_007838 [Ciborinia camelliae]|nr:hypothetical protein NHQ30_007838 [Ciborinia camelliae]
MPANPIHNILDTGLRWLGGDKNAVQRTKKQWEEEDSDHNSLRMHQMARNMGLESDSEDENFNTNKPRKYREKGKYDPPTDLPTDTSTPFGSPFSSGASNTKGIATPMTNVISSPAGQTGAPPIDYYSAPDEYQGWAWRDGEAQASTRDQPSGQASPHVINNSRNSSEYPSVNMGEIRNRWGQSEDPTQPNYIPPYRNYIPPDRGYGSSQVGSPRSSGQSPVELPTSVNWLHSGQSPVELPTSANSPQNGTPVNGRAYQRNNNQHTTGQGHSHPNLPAPRSPRSMFDSVRDFADQNAAISIRHEDFRPNTSYHATPARKPVPSSPSIEPSTKEKSKDKSETHYDKSEQEKIRRQNEEQVIRERRERNLKNSQANQELPPSLPPKIPLSPTIRPPLSSRPATSPASVPTYVSPLPAPPTGDFESNNTRSGNFNSPPYPVSLPASRGRRRHSTASSTWQNNMDFNSSSPPYPVTPASYHLNGWNNHNGIQKQAIHSAIKHELLHGHQRMAGPTPTFRSAYPDAHELEGVNPQAPRDEILRTTPRIESPCVKKETVSGTNLMMPGVQLPVRSRHPVVARSGRGVRRSSFSAIPEIFQWESLWKSEWESQFGVDANRGWTRTAAEPGKLAVPGTEYSEKRTEHSEKRTEHCWNRTEHKHRNNGHHSTRVFSDKYENGGAWVRKRK